MRAMLLYIDRLFTPSVVLLLLACVFLVAVAQAQHATMKHQVSGQILDEVQLSPIPFASILVKGSNVGTASDIDGNFSLVLSHGAYILKVSAIGYQTKDFPLEVTMDQDEALEIHLRPSVLQMDEVMVRADASSTSDIAAPQGKLNATEDLLQRVSGVEMIQRANFAWEPAIRGMSGGQVGLVIDGMKIYGACVDKMDPASSYVEPENLEKLEVTKGGFDLTQASQIGGSVNLITEKPDFTRPYELQVETGYESVAALRRMRVAGGGTRGRFATRGSFSYRKAEDFSPGGSSPIPNSGFEKRNYKISLASKLSDRHSLTASFLGDDAWNIGYPVLLMDARLAQARIYSLAYQGTLSSPLLKTIEGRAYHNRVDHHMDDRDRDVMERPVMRGMLMPMYGYTDTWGGLIRTDGNLGKNRIGLTLDAHQVKQFGDMWMFSLYPNIPDMYLLNLGDVVALNTATTVEASRSIAKKINLLINARLDVSWRDVEREEMKSIFRARYGVEKLANQYRFLSGSAIVEYALRPTTRLRLSLANTARLPSNVENYGHYVYNYVDGYFYTGNPLLKPERSRQLELGLEHTTRNMALRFSAFYNSLRDYIIGVSDPGIGDDLAGRTTVYRFRVYQNAERAMLAGAEMSGLYEVFSGLDLAGSLSYTYGHNISLNDPMPMVPPLKGFVSIRYRQERWWSEMESRWAMPQNRASMAADEDKTDGFNVLSIRGGVQVVSQVALKMGIENILDTFYHEHLSIGNLPGRGRNVFVAMSLSL